MSEIQQNFEKLNPAQFEKLAGEPFWIIADALLYLMGYKCPETEDHKIKLLENDATAQRLVSYILAAIEMEELTIHNYNPLVYFHQADEEADTEIKQSLYAGKVKPKEFVEWARALPLDIPIFMALAVNDKNLDEREKASLLKIIIGMAIKGYNYDPASKRNPTAKEISDDLLLLGITLDEDTIRKWLKEAAMFLPTDWNKET